MASTDNVTYRHAHPSQPQTRDKRSTPDPRWPWVTERPQVLGLAAASGVAFGFLLQKGGVAKFDILIGMLLLEDFVVAKVMLSAVVVGMVGFALLQRSGRVRAQIKETSYGANALGGLLFGVGFALMAYCPGTNAAAVGQGNLDALVGMAGLMAGSYAFARTPKRWRARLSRWGQRGKLTLPDLVGARTPVVVAVLAPLLVGLLALLEVLER